jgi:hypothetical protein
MVHFGTFAKLFIGLFVERALQLTDFVRQLLVFVEGSGLFGADTPTQRKYFVRVDVTDEFPFIVTPWTRFLERGESL